jgi:DHA1 family multidrug/chloramphenicol efflux transport protein-like MFS transporter
MKKLYLFAFFLVVYEFTTYVANDMIMPGMLSVVKELQLFLGPLSERFGKRNVILMGNILFFFMTLFIMFAQNIHSFMLARFLQGTGLGFIAMGYALIHENFDDKTAVKTFALMSNISILAPLLGPLLGVAILIRFGWRYIFIVIGLLAIIAFIGLFKFTPMSTSPKHPLNLLANLKIYAKILCTRQFIIGTLSSGIATLPIIVWIGLSPTIIMKTQGLTMIDYGLYQLLAIGGLMLSSILMQFIAGKFSFSRLMIMMSFISLIGLSLSFLFNDNLNIVAFGMFLYSFGLGIFNNLVIRLIMIIPNVSQSMLSSLMVFLQTLIFSIGTEISTTICDAFNYSLLSFASINFVLGCVFFIMVSLYAHMNKHKEWD